MLTQYDEDHYQSPVHGYKNPEVMRDFVKRFDDLINQEFSDKEIILHVSGGSGISLAAACMLLSKYEITDYLVYNGHCCKHATIFCENNYSNPKYIHLIIDDYIFSGTTIRKIINNKPSIDFEFSGIVVIKKYFKICSPFNNIPIYALNGNTH